MVVERHLLLCELAQQCFLKSSWVSSLLWCESCQKCFVVSFSLVLLKSALTQTHTERQEITRQKDILWNIIILCVVCTFVCFTARIIICTVVVLPQIITGCYVRADILYSNTNAHTYSHRHKHTRTCGNAPQKKHAKFQLRMRPQQKDKAGVFANVRRTKTSQWVLCGFAPDCRARKTIPFLPIRINM